MSDPYDGALRRRAHEVAQVERIPLEDGVYAALLGPSFETAAEIRMLERVGADAVGMSTVPEVIAARHAGVRVVGISAITNVVGAEIPTHDAVLQAAHEMAPRFLRLIRRIVRGLPG
jgi:purine-nucleoside phosphorylase